MAGLNAGLEILQDGALLGIYPEGTRSPDGALYRGKTGIAKLVLGSGAPVVPVAMIGTEKVQPIGKKLPRLHRVGMVFGEPLHFGKDPEAVGNRTRERDITDQVMSSLQALSGQEYKDRYAPKKS